MTSESVLEREIREQPAALERILAEVGGDIAPIAAAVERAAPRYVLIAARGTSDNAARYAQYLFGARLGLPVALAAPALTTVYAGESRLQVRDGLAIGISQSGRSPDVVEVLRAARAGGSPAVAITNDPSSPLAEAADFVIPLRAGEERAVAATKTYTTSLLALAALCAGLRGSSEDLERLRAMPGAVASAVDLAFEDVPALDRLSGAHHLLSVGRGFNYATAFEIALKVRELCAVVAEGWSPADLLHGPIAATAPQTPVLVTEFEGPSRGSLDDVIEALERRDAVPAIITDRPELAGGRTVLRTPGGLEEWLTPLVAIVPGQVFAMRQAALRGLDVDSPAGLTKVTVTY
jgi:glucosamine--fructose-6-phosphate aminotransferase (isomerizing)